MTEPRARVLVGLLVLVVLVTLASLPVRADTESELRFARARLAAVQAELNVLAGQYAAAETRYARTETQIEMALARMDRIQDRMDAIQSLLATRVRDVYELGGTTTLQLLLTSDSFVQFSDRLQFVGRMAQGDADLLTESGVTGEELRRTREDLGALSRRQAGEIRTLAGQREEIEKKFAEAQSLVASLQRRLAEEEAAASARATALARAVGGGPLQACPVGPPRAFGDDFGDPRPGGRTHQGIDILAPYGTPVYAAQTGRFVQDSNTLGGISGQVYADTGDYTYYAHLSSYAGVPSGAHVSAGTAIGHVGNSGDAAGGPYHLHFEYHPGGGGAVDPYNLLVAVCG